MSGETPEASSAILTLPNAVSVVRLLMIPLFLWLLVGRDAPAAAGFLLLVIGGTDWVDGYLARRLGQVSEFGKLLDPLADRLAVATAVVAGWATGVLPWPLALALIVREALVGLGALILGMKGRGKLEVRYLGKLATFILYGAIPAFYVAAGGVGEAFFEPLAWATGVIGTVLYYWVGFSYAGDVRRQLAAPGDG
jgi:cardiolipin synthase